MSSTALTKDEQANVRAALRYLRVKCGSWLATAKVLKMEQSTVANIVRLRRIVNGEHAVRIAKVARVSVDDVIRGVYPPPYDCPCCGRRTETRTG